MIYSFDEELDYCEVCGAPVDHNISLCDDCVIREANHAIDPVCPMCHQECDYLDANGVCPDCSDIVDYEINCARANKY